MSQENDPAKLLQSVVDQYMPYVNGVVIASNEGQIRPIVNAVNAVRAAVSPRSSGISQPVTDQSSLINEPVEKGFAKLADCLKELVLLLAKNKQEQLRLESPSSENV